ncbi:unnamed protein product [Acanthoscelides obtectus]|uniref:Uncharacterized protein n=1 Tax=Acanthoscelides obtectus TaxID=200917 RepID=A0A9P0M0I7_ACAOB|nr:unnamed protein product [Acanthoscelides obtectus]CAK1688219.1 hypothetical protein AOBTE_LOCUS36618 [Acanthoscelides obtectus]
MVCDFQQLRVSDLIQHSNFLYLYIFLEANHELMPCPLRALELVGAFLVTEPYCFVGGIHRPSQVILFGEGEAARHESLQKKVKQKI